MFSRLFRFPIVALASLLVFTTSAVPALSAAIEGETQAPLEEEAVEDTRIKLRGLPSVGDATVIHFSILGDETSVFVQNKGTSDVCLTLHSALITRSFESEESFTELPVPIRTASGQTGMVTGYTEKKLTIDPDEGSNFKLNEPFTAQIKGRLIKDLDECYVHLEEQAESSRAERSRNETLEQLREN